MAHARKPKITVRHHRGSMKITVTVKKPSHAKKTHAKRGKKVYGAAAKAHAKRVAKMRRRRARR